MIVKHVASIGTHHEIYNRYFIIAGKKLGFSIFKLGFAQVMKFDGRTLDVVFHHYTFFLIGRLLVKQNFGLLLKQIRPRVYDRVD